MAVTLEHLKSAVADLEKENTTLNGTIAVGIVKLYVKRQEQSEGYWKRRCKAAEKFIKESPCDPDITSKQIEAYNEWLNSH